MMMDGTPQQQPQAAGDKGGKVVDDDDDGEIDLDAIEALEAEAIKQRDERRQKQQQQQPSHQRNDAAADKDARARDDSQLLSPPVIQSSQAQHQAFQKRVYFGQVIEQLGYKQTIQNHEGISNPEEALNKIKFLAGSEMARRSGKKRGPSGQIEYYESDRIMMEDVVREVIEKNLSTVLH
jgi:hypothetical protein